ncbi:MAG: cytidylate kinase family protein [Desulfobacteraceae bacterium]|nr:cytidylate kinase family protein [Desulfobacteraceae bacterium]
MSLITISQDFGTEGYTIAKQVGDALDLEVYDDARLKDEALKEGISEEYLKGLEEKAPGFFDRLMGRKPDIYLDVLQSVVYRISRQGEGIVVGHGSQMLLKDFGCALHVRIHASLPKRAELMAEQRGIEYQVAEKIILKKDEEYKGFFKYAFQMDPNDPDLYDLVLNTGKISTETAAKYIADLGRSEEIKACSLEALESMDRMSLERRIHAALTENEIFSKMISVEVSEPGTVYIYGIVTSENEKARIVDTVKNIKEINKVKNNVVVVAGY